MDWSLFHLLIAWLGNHPALADYIEDFVTYWAVPANARFVPPGGAGPV